MSVTTRVNTHVQARVWSRATVYTANEMMRALMEIVQQRGLDMDYMSDNLEIILKGLRTWTTMHCLKGASLEICNAHGSVLGVHDLTLNYNTEANGREEYFETRIELLAHKREQLPTGCRYRVVADLHPGAPPVSGWGETQRADTSHLRRQDFGKIIGTARIDTSYTAWL